MKDRVYALLRKGNYLKTIREEHIFVHGVDPIGILYAKLDSEICRNCHARIFPQCHIALPNGQPRIDQIGKTAEPSQLEPNR